MTPKTRINRLIVMLLCASAVQACGLKGDLYLPEPDIATPEETAESDTDNDPDERKNGQSE